MKYYRIRAKLASPLFVQENRQSNAARGLPYLPGSTLRGAIAAHHLRKGGKADDAAFRELFLDHPACFPNLLPSNLSDQVSLPLPMTACSCKRSPGFISPDDHGVGDALAAIVAARLEERPLADPFLCKTCQEDMKPFRGFWNGNTVAPEKFEPMMLYQRHTGIDRHTGTAASSIFYITQGIAESRKGSESTDHPQFLSGGTFLHENQIEILSGWLTGTIFAGADRTRGMGEMALTLKESVAPNFDLEDWDKGFRKKLASLTSKELPFGLYFSLGLDSHAILIDQFLRPSSEIMLDHPDIIRETQVIRQHSVRGWQSCHRLPKPEDTALSMGSVCLFRYTGKDLAGLAAYLKRLTIEGIGLRRAEGFGRITVCDPIHVKEVL